MSRKMSFGLGALVLTLIAGSRWFVRIEQRTNLVPTITREKANPLISQGSNETALQPDLKRLEDEHVRLLSALNSATNENAQLEKANEHIEHAIKLFKEIADQSNSQNQDPTNAYPTIRHVLAGIGKQQRLISDMESKWGVADEEKLPPEEEKGLQQAMLVIASEMMRLGQAAEHLKGDSKGDFPQPTTAEAFADYSTCYFYGALNLDAGQFSAINGILQKYASIAESVGPI